MRTDILEKHLLELQPQLKDYAFSLTGDRDKAKDLLQDTYLNALTSIKKPDTQQYLTCWIFSIMKNVFINDFRKKKRYLLMYNNTYDSRIDEFRSSECNEEEKQLRNHELNEAMNGLSNRLKDAFILYAKGYKYREISEIMNLPIDNIRTRIFVTRQRLQKRLKDYK